MSPIKEHTDSPTVGPLHGPSSRGCNGSFAGIKTPRNGSSARIASFAPTPDGPSKATISTRTTSWSCRPRIGSTHWAARAALFFSTRPNLKKGRPLRAALPLLRAQSWVPAYAALFPGRRHQIGERGHHRNTADDLVALDPDQLGDQPAHGVIALERRFLAVRGDQVRLMRRQVLHADRQHQPARW